MRPPHVASTSYEYERARRFLRIHFHTSNELSVIDEESSCSFSASYYRKKTLSRIKTYNSLVSLADDQDRDNVRFMEASSR